VGKRSVPRGVTLKGPDGVDLGFAEGEDGDLQVQTADYHDPAVLSPREQFELAVWLLQRLPGLQGSSEQVAPRSQREANLIADAQNLAEPVDPAKESSSVPPAPAGAGLMGLQPIAFTQMSRHWDAERVLSKLDCGFHRVVDRVDVIHPWPGAQITWGTYLGYPDAIHVKLELHDGGLAALAEHPELFTFLARNPEVTPQELCDELRRLGFQDETAQTVKLELEEVDRD